MIPLDRVLVRGSNERVLTFPAVAEIVEFGLVPGELRVVVNHPTPWPAVKIDENPPSQAATLWVFILIDWQWYATGAERLRPNQISGASKPQEGDVNQFIAVNWLFDPGRWREMAGYVPKDGESVGFMVVAGSTRSDDNTPVEERTKVIEIVWPGAQGVMPIQPVWIEGQEVEPVPHPDPDPGPPPDPIPPDFQGRMLLALIDDIRGKLDTMEQMILLA